MSWIIDEWQGCYPSNWKGMIVSEAMSHPAKFSSKLIRRIYEHMRDEGWLKEGDTVLDCFGGVALGALDAMRLGFRWRGIELEAKFHELGQAEYQCFGINPNTWKRYYHRPKMLAFFRESRVLCPSCEAAWNDIAGRKIPSREPHVFRGNIALWNARFASMPHWCSDAKLLQGDSRFLLKVLGNGHNGAVSSPPYADSVNTGTAGIDWEKAGRPDRLTTKAFGIQGANGREERYGFTEGQLGTMPARNFDAAISSPPFEHQSADGGWQMLGKYAEQGKLTVKQVKGNGHKSYPSWDKDRDTSYGESEGQMSQMKTTQEGFSAAISSPPFRHSEGGTSEPKPGGTIDAALYARHAAGNSAAEGYGATNGQLANMGEGDFEAAISSPPYGVEALGHHGEPNEIDIAKKLQSRIAGASYGGESGQLGEMRSDGFDAAVSSPPFESSLSRDGRDYADLKIAKDLEASHGRTFRGSFIGTDYGDTPGNMGNDSGDDFWLAARQIVEQVYLALAPGAHAAWVVKAFVKNKELVDFPDQWRQLCEAVGFVTVHEHRALLVHSHGKSHTLDGDVIEHKTESKSFFRRLAEKKGSPRIDFETVWCMVKPEVES